MNGLDKILLEGRVEDAKNLLNKTYDDMDYVGDIVGDFVDGDPSGNNKYLMWMVKRWAEEQENTGIIVDLVKDYHKLLPKITNALAIKVFGAEADSNAIVSPKSIDSYPTLDDLYKIVDAAQQLESRKEVETQAKSGANKIYEDERWLVVRPDTRDASCYYGAGTKWCTAMKNAEHFDNYNKKGRLYYLIDKSRDLGRYYKVALYKEFGDRGRHEYWNVGEWYDEVDDRLNSDMLEVIVALLPEKLGSSIAQDFKKEEEENVLSKPTAQEFGEKFITWVGNKYPNGDLIKSLSGPWALQAFVGEGYDDPYIAMSARKYEGYVNIAIFDDANPDEIVVDLNVDITGGKYFEISQSLRYGTPDFEDRFFRFDLNDEFTERSFEVFYNQLIYWWIRNRILNSDELIKKVDLDEVYWQQGGHSGQSLRFHYPPRKGTMTQLFTDYVINNPGRTRQQFYEDVLERKHTPGHNTTFFGGILSAGIVKGERGPGRGRGMQFYKGPNYDAWTQGKLKRV
tara:strand:- start:355 stop:1887 length:1533 start_codon:yes stop_codon:yes gene_type:complete